MNKPLVSIVIPVYNVESYLSQCLDSVLKQSYSNFEIILVDDGSTDGSSLICDEYSKRDRRVKAFHQKNQGASVARNFALSIISGAFVIFLDADDYWLLTNCLETLVDVAIQNEADIVRGEYKMVDIEGNDLFEREINERKAMASYKKLTSYEFLTDVIQGEFFLVLFLIRCKKISNLRFREEQRFLEDMDFYSRLFLRPLNCIFIPLRFYAYRKHTLNASSNLSVRQLANSFQMCDYLADYARQANCMRMKHYFEYRSVMMYYWTLETVSYGSYYKDRNSLIEQLELNRLHKRTQLRMWRYAVFNKYFPFILVSPFWGIILLRIKFIIAICFHSIISKLKCFFYEK